MRVIYLYSLTCFPFSTPKTIFFYEIDFVNVHTSSGQYYWNKFNHLLKKFLENLLTCPFYGFAFSLNKILSLWKFFMKENVTRDFYMRSSQSRPTPMLLKCVYFPLFKYYIWCLPFDYRLIVFITNVNFKCDSFLLFSPRQSLRELVFIVRNRNLMLL